MKGAQRRATRYPALASIRWAWMTRRSGSLWPAILFHTLADLGLIISDRLWVT